MRSTTARTRPLLSSLVSCVVVFFIGLAAEAVAGPADIEGAVRCAIDGNRITVEIERIANNTSSTTTGLLYVKVSMTLQPDIRIRDRGHPAARRRITMGDRNGRLGPGEIHNNIRLRLDYQAPRIETEPYYVHVYTSQDPDEDTVLDSHTFQKTITIDTRGGSGWSSDEDHGNERGQATRVGTPSTTRGNLERRGDVDYFRVEVPADGRLRVATSGTTDTHGYLQGAQGQHLAGNANAGEGNNFRIERNVARGTYYIAVFGDRGRTAMGPYNLHVGFSASGGGGTAQDDHGSTRQRARDVRPTSTTAGVLERRGDVDYFRVAITRNGQLEAVTSGGTDTVGYLQDANGRYLAGNDNHGNDRNFRIVRQVARGTYYVAVAGASNRTVTGVYTLWLRFTEGGGGGTSDTHGNTRARATRVGLNSATRGALEQPGDVDYFRVTVTRAGQLRMATSGRTNTFGYLQDANGRQLAENDDNGNDRNFRIVRQVPAGTYYVALVGANRRSVTGAYNLHVSFTAGGPAAADHGNTRGTAARIGPNANTPGALERRGDIDYFRVDVTQAGTVTVFTDGETDTFGYFGGADGRWLSRNDHSGGGVNFRIVRQVTPGTYYVAVTGGKNRSATGPYTLRVRFTVGVTTDDHGNTLERATPFPLAESRNGRTGVLPGALEQRNDVDYFRVSLPSAGQLTANTSGTTDTVGYLRDANGRHLAGGDDRTGNAGVGRNFEIIHRISSRGTYYVAVVGGGSRTATGSYGLHVAFELPSEPAQPDGDGNTTCADADDPLAEVLEVGGTDGDGLIGQDHVDLIEIDSPDDRDFFRIEVARAGLLRVEGSSVGPIADPYGYLYGANCGLLAEDDNSGESSDFRIDQRVEAGTYYAAIKNVNEANEGRGSFTITASLDIHGHERGRATPVTPGSEGDEASSPGYLSWEGDVDYFRIDLPEDGRLVVRTMGPTDTYGYLQGATSGEDDNSGSEGNFRIDRELKAGTYYVAVVGGRERAGIGPYTLHAWSDVEPDGSCYRTCPDLCRVVSFSRLRNECEQACTNRNPVFYYSDRGCISLDIEDPGFESTVCLWTDSC